MVDKKRVSFEKAANIPCMYVPMFYDVYNEDGTIKEMKCINPNIRCDKKILF